MSARVTILCLLLAACAGAPESERKPKPEDGAIASKGPALSKAQLEDLKRFETLWRARDQGAVAVREALARDPDTAFWLARLFVRDAVLALDRGLASPGEIEQVAASAGDSPLDRAVKELAAMGGAAVPCVREDLLRHPFADRRELGVHVMQAIGRPALETLIAALAESDPRLRHAAARALGGMVSDARARAGLANATTDPDFVVRAAAWQSLARAGDDERARLLAALAGESDAFVRRALAQSLAAFRTRAVAEAIVAYRVRCVQERDTRGIEIADATLHALSGRKNAGGDAFWRAWLATLSQDRDAPLPPIRRETDAKGK